MNIQKSKNPKYLFQRKRVSFVRRIFEKGLNAAGYILIGLKERGSEFLHEFAESAPRRDPRFSLLRALILESDDKKIEKNTITVNLRRLKRAGLIRKIEKQKQKIYCLTDRGEKFVTYIENRYNILSKPWDNKIRLVIFDIPESKKSLREWLRQELLLMQFRALQKSAYIGRYPLPEDFYQELIKNEIFENIHIFTIDQSDKKEEILQILK